MFGLSLTERIQRLRETKQVILEDIGKAEEGAREVISQAHADLARYASAKAELGKI